MGKQVIDGQRPPKPAPMAPIRFRALAVEPIAAPETIEVSMSDWAELDAWQDTEPMDLRIQGENSTAGKEQSFP